MSLDTHLEIVLTSGCSQKTCGSLTYVPVIRALFLGDFCLPCQNVSLRKSRLMPFPPTLQPPTSPAHREASTFEETGRSKSLTGGMDSFRLEKEKKSDGQFNRS